VLVNTGTYNILNNFVTVGKILIPDESLIERVKSIKDELDVGLALVSCENIDSKPVLLGLIYNVASAHKYGYNKLRKLDSEMILVLAGKNIFHEAVNKVTPKVGGCALIILLSNNESKILEALNFVREHLKDNFKEIELPPSFSLSNMEMVENFALFYAWYK
jgi:hypothetical protein